VEDWLAPVGDAEGFRRRSPETFHRGQAPMFEWNSNLVPSYMSTTAGSNRSVQPAASSPAPIMIHARFSRELDGAHAG
jgi:hypothetical protein